MKRCPITYALIAEDERYSKAGLNLLSRKLETLEDLPFTPAEFRKEAQRRAVKMSIQGVQPKVSAILKISENRFELVDIQGKYIIKPQNADFPELPENESLTMKMAQQTGIEVPAFGLAYCKDGSLAYFIKRFDRVGHKGKLSLEDFAQLAGKNRFTKYDASIELLIKVVNKYCTYPIVERLKLYERIIFNFLVGNEDMHIKNYSLITRNNKVELSPAYDFVNSTLLLPGTQEESALPLRGKKNKLNRKDLVDYLAIERLELNEKVVSEKLDKMIRCIPDWIELIKMSFLSPDLKEHFEEIIHQRSLKLM